MYRTNIGRELNSLNWRIFTTPTNLNLVNIFKPGAHGPQDRARLVS